jgi:hypothetical protein
MDRKCSVCTNISSQQNPSSPKCFTIQSADTIIHIVFKNVPTASARFPIPSPRHPIDALLPHARPHKRGNGLIRRARIGHHCFVRRRRETRQGRSVVQWINVHHHATRTMMQSNFRQTVLRTQCQSFLRILSQFFKTTFDGKFCVVLLFFGGILKLAKNITIYC